MFISRFAIDRIVSVSERIAYAQIDMKPFQAAIYNVYAPTATVSEEERKEFLLRLSDSFTRSKYTLK